MIKLAFEIKELLILNVEKILELSGLHGEHLTAGSHFYLVELEKASASLFNTVVQIFLGNHHSDARG
jgi:hypothetical protein